MPELTFDTDLGDRSSLSMRADLASPSHEPPATRSATVSDAIRALEENHSLGVEKLRDLVASDEPLARGDIMRIAEKFIGASDNDAPTEAVASQLSGILDERSRAILKEFATTAIECAREAPIDCSTNSHIEALRAFARGIDAPISTDAKRDHSPLEPNGL